MKIKGVETEVIQLRKECLVTEKQIAEIREDKSQLELKYNKEL